MPRLRTPPTDPATSIHPHAGDLARCAALAASRGVSRACVLRDLLRSALDQAEAEASTPDGPDVDPRIVVDEDVVAMALRLAEGASL